MFKEKIRKWLGINDMWTLSDVCAKLSESYVVLATDDQKLVNTMIKVPPKKNGVLVLGNRTAVIGNLISAEN